MVVAGVGGSRGVAAAEVIALVEESLARAGLAPGDLTGLATVTAKAGEAGIVAAAAHFGVPLTTFPAEALAATPVPTPSPAPLATLGTPSVAEAAALLAAPGGELLVPKRKSARATVAIARAPRGGPCPVRPFKETDR